LGTEDEGGVKSAKSSRIKKKENSKTQISNSTTAMDNDNIDHSRAGSMISMQSMTMKGLDLDPKELMKMKT